MSAPRDLGPDFRSWLRDVPPMPPGLPVRTLDQTRRTRQRRRWLWFLPGRKPTAGADDQDSPGRPATHFTTALSGGARTMFSPAKLVTTAAAAALAGALLLAGTFTTQQQPAPAAPGAYEPGVITPVQGTMLVRAQSETGTLALETGGPVWTDEWWLTEYRVDDERLNGKAVSRHNRNVGTAKGEFGGTRMIAIRIDNDGGSWVGTGRAYSDPQTSGIHYQIHFEGQGGYEGLDAIIALDNETSTAPFEVSGAIISGGLPEMPEPVPEPAE